MQGSTRRQFLAGIAGAGVATATGAGRQVAGQPKERRDAIIDAHVHVWSADTEKYPLARGFEKKDLWFPSFSIEELIEHGRSAGVGRFNLIQMTWYGLDHRYILDAIAADPKRFVGTGIVPAVVDVALANPGRTMIDLSRGGIRAFRIRGKSTRPALGDGREWMDHPGYASMFTAGAEYNLALSFLMTPTDLPELDRMCALHPETPVIIDHFCLIGRNNEFIADEIDSLCRMARHKRVMLKLGAFYGLGKKQPPYLDMLRLIRRVVDAFGPQRCMWESDAPLQAKNDHTFDAAVAVIRDHADFLSESDKRQILQGTAERFFFEQRSP